MQKERLVTNFCHNREEQVTLDKENKTLLNRDIILIILPNSHEGLLFSKPMKVKTKIQSSCKPLIKLTLGDRIKCTESC